MWRMFYILHIRREIGGKIKGMEGLSEIIRELFKRDLRTSPLETAIFLGILFGFFAALVLANSVRRKKERLLYLQRLEKKWKDLCEKYSLTEEEKAYLEEVSSFLKNPEKKYLLLTDYKILSHTIEDFQRDKGREEAREEENERKLKLFESLMKKTGLDEKQETEERLPIQRRKNVRRQVDIDARLAPIEHETAHIEAKMLDLSSGGCRIENPGRRFQVGDDLKISFSFNGKDYKDIPCEVVRTGAGKKTLHISFLRSSSHA
jgi:hypothetical protein